MKVNRTTTNTCSKLTEADQSNTMQSTASIAIWKLEQVFNETG